MQNCGIVGYSVIVVEPSNFLVILLYDFEVLFVSNSISRNRVPFFRFIGCLGTDLDYFIRVFSADRLKLSLSDRNFAMFSFICRASFLLPIIPTRKSSAYLTYESLRY